MNLTCQNCGATVDTERAKACCGAPAFGVTMDMGQMASRVVFDSKGTIVKAVRL